MDYKSSKIPPDLDLPNLGDIPHDKSIKVFVRTRPLLQKEINNGEENVLNIIPSEKKILIDDGEKGTFTYDGVFDENASQQDVFQQVVTPILPLIKSGNNVTIIAYGQTGSGKTYTMGTDPSHSQREEGILQKVINTLLDVQKITKSSTPTKPTTLRTISLKITFLEIYGSIIYDLLAARDVVSTKNDGVGGLIPAGCREEIAYSADEALGLLRKGNSLRQMTSTPMNPHSSRSHALISIVVFHRNGLQHTSSGCLRLVDLAGAEGVGRNHMKGKGFSEGVSINQGLLAIGKVLAALNNKDAHIPYRESMVTRLLRDALGGSSYTSVVACVNPTSSNITVTTNTLHFAEQARNIKNKTYGMSTIKRKGIKRCSEDISATPAHWKKFVNGNIKLDHNSTISTPGHKPPLSKVPKLNNTFVTPLNKDFAASKPWVFPTQQNLPHECPFPSLSQPIFEEDSPTRSIIEPLAMNNITIQVSPIVEQINARLNETRMMFEEKMDKRMKEMGEQIAQTVIMQLMKTSVANRRHSRRLLLKQMERENTFQSPALKVKDENASQVMANMNETKSYNTKTDYVQSTRPRKPFDEISNVTAYREDTDHATDNDISSNTTMEKQSHHKKGRLTSTAICGNRVVRKSARLSSKFCFSNNISHIGNVESLSTFQNTTDETALSDIDFSATMENTIIFNDASPDLVHRQARQVHSDLTVVAKGKKSFHDETTLLARSSPEKEVLVPSHYVSSNDMLGQPLFLDNTVCLKTKSPVIKRPSRKSALIAMQKNHALLCNESPAPAKRRTSRKLSISKNVANTTVQSRLNSSTQSAVSNKWELIISPTLKMKQEKEILSALNSGNLRELQKLPTVGPKTAMVIHNFRLAYGKFKKVEDLKDVPGLPKAYFNRFMKANLVCQIDFIGL